MQSILSKLKIKTSSENKHKFYQDILFCLRFNAKGAYIEVTNTNLEKIESFDYRLYEGITRNILKAIEKINGRNLYKIEWDNEENESEIYLAENDYLIELLKQADNFVYSNLKKIEFNSYISQVTVIIEGETSLKTKISVNTENKNISIDKCFLLNENYVFFENTIYPINEIGEEFYKINLFQTNVLDHEIEKYLSILFSYFENIKVIYKDYNQKQGKLISTNPVMIIEEVDAENSLHLRILESIIGFDPDFISDYQISKMVSLNDMERTINVSDIKAINILEYTKDLEKKLNKYKKTLHEAKNFYQQENNFIIEENLACELIQNDLIDILSKYTVFGSEKLKHYNLKPITPQLKLSVSYGIDFFEGDASLDIEGQLFSVFEAIDLYNKNSYIPLNDGTKGIINKSYIDKLKRIFKKQNKKIKISFFDLPILEEVLEEKIYKKSFKDYSEIFLGFNKLHSKKVKVSNINAELRDYQIQGYKWLKYLYDNNLGGCLADDMGLGKTIQTLALLSEIYPKEKQSSIIVVPKSLLFNWENEINKFTSNISYYIYYANNRDFEEAKNKNIIITTYAILRNEIEKFRDYEFNCIILDESQNIKNIQTQSAKSVMLLNSRHRFALSGTPIENNLGELYSLFRFLNPTMFGSVEDFNNNYINPMQKENNKDVLEELRKKIYPFILRRLKKDVLKDLPEKIEQNLIVEMSREQILLYEKRRRFYYDTIREQVNDSGIEKSQFFIFQAINELRQIASIPESKTDNKIVSPKREVLMENIVDVVANNHKVLVFVNYLDAIDYITQDLESNNIEYLTMSGSTKNRQELVDKFQNNSKYKVFVMTLKTGGVGLNLTMADYVFIYEPWWNKSSENQAVDRSHRMGQDKTVFSYKLITKGTIEEKILKLQEKKSELFNSIISSDDSSIKSFSKEDIDYIFG